MSLPSGKQIIWTVIIAFVLYAVLTDPSDSADSTGNAWDHLKDGLNAIGTFFDGLLSR